MNERNILDEFDWVSARAQCTPFTVFGRVRSQVKEDTGKRNSLTVEGGSSATFSFDTGPNWFSVSWRFLDKYRGVSFTLSANGIEVRDASSHNLLHDGILTISDDGQCRLRVGDKELNLWQFRKLALHDLFFINQKVTS
jgi:hypothetical protein